jgi:hypothetical protein
LAAVGQQWTLSEGFAQTAGELREFVFVAMDPVLDGFEGVFVELVRVGERYVLRHTAAVSGNRFVEIDLSSEDQTLALFEKHTIRCVNRSS